MTKQSQARGVEPNIVPIPGWSRVLDPVFLQAHQLVDRIPREELIGLIPQLRQAAEKNGLLEAVGKKNLSSVPGTESPTAGPVAFQGNG